MTLNADGTFSCEDPEAAWIADQQPHVVRIYRTMSGEAFIIWCDTCDRKIGREGSYQEAYGVLARHERGEDGD